MIISKKNEVYLTVKTDKGIARELSDFFTFEVPGAKFMPQYRNRMWDGKIRLYSLQTGEIYFGLLPYIEEFAKRNEIEIEYEESVNGQQELRDAGWYTKFLDMLLFWPAFWSFPQLLQSRRPRPSCRRRPWLKV